VFYLVVSVVILSTEPHCLYDTAYTVTWLKTKKKVVEDSLYIVVKLRCPRTHKYACPRNTTQVQVVYYIYSTGP